jgi:hypothetical protein
MSILFLELILWQQKQNKESSNLTGLKLYWQKRTSLTKSLLKKWAWCLILLPVSVTMKASLHFLMLRNIALALNVDIRELLVPTK